MKFLYTIVKISPNTASGDAVSVGLIAFNEKEARVLFSESRKNLAKKLVSPELVDFLCKQLVSKVNELNKIKNRKINSLFPEGFVLEPSYIDYLSKYSNGLFQFSKANVFLKLLNDENFNLLFENIIDKIEFKPAKHHKAINLTKVVEEKLISKVKDKVHTNIKLDNTLVPNLYFTFDIDCIGKNGSFIGAKSLDFTKTRGTLDTTISHYTNLIAYLSLSYQKDIKRNKFYLIGEEPKEINTPEHEIWDAIQNNDFYKVINPEQSDLIATKIEESKATKFFN